MSSFVILEKAPGITISEHELQDAKKIVVESPMGTHEQLRGGFGYLWRAGRNGEYAIKCFLGGGEEAADSEFKTLVALMQSGCARVPKIYCRGILTDNDGIDYPAIVESYVDGQSLWDLLASGRLSGSAKRGLTAIQSASIAL